MAPDFTMVGNLPLPKRLLQLIETGRWPKTHAEELHQNVRPLVSKERIQLFAPEQDRIYFVRPPFSTVATRMGNEDGFWARFGALEQIAQNYPSSLETLVWDQILRFSLTTVITSLVPQ